MASGEMHVPCLSRESFIVSLWLAAGIFVRRLRRAAYVRGMLSGSPTAAAPFERANAFADRLAELPIEGWLAIGNALLREAGDACRCRALSLVDAAITEQGLAVPAWYIRDAVETSAHGARDVPRRWTRTERIAFAAALGAADAAALAMLVSNHLPAGDVRLLCDPFAEVIAAIYYPPTIA